jgi:hypothetical protein
MFPFTKVETSEKKVVELSAPISDSMDRTEHTPLTVGEIKVEINPIDYDSDDEVDEETDEEVAEINGLFEPKPPVIEKHETVLSLEAEKESNETVPTVEVEIKVEPTESLTSILCNLLSKCFTRTKQ